jgi:hypothetical protein
VGCVTGEKASLAVYFASGSLTQHLFCVFDDSYIRLSQRILVLFCCCVLCDEKRILYACPPFVEVIIFCTAVDVSPTQRGMDILSPCCGYLTSQLSVCEGGFSSLLVIKPVLFSFHLISVVVSGGSLTVL